MRWAALVLVVILAGSRVAAADEDDTWREQSRKAVDVRGLTVLEINNSRGRVDLTPSKDGQLHLTALKIIRRGSQSEAREAAKEIVVALKSSGDRYIVDVSYPRHTHVHLGFAELFDFDSHRYPRSEVRITAEVPPSLSVAVRSSSGDIRTEGLAGGQTLRSSSGDIEVDSAAGRVDVSTSSGDVSAVGLHAARLSSSSGDLEVREVAGPLRASTTSGDISVKGAQDSLILLSRSGDITTDAAPHGLRGESSSGEVVADYAAGAVQVGTSSGDVRLGLREPLAGVDVSTSSGQIRLSLDPAVRCALDLRTSSGSFEVALPMDMKQASRRNLTGVIRGGNTPVQLHTASGDITVMGGGR
jgi:DUF4097 and DUF4098 domain-containing protein YvlB